jgi:hypothetical protein
MGSPLQYDTTTQKTILFTATAVKTSNPTKQENDHEEDGARDGNNRIRKRSTE